VTEPAPSGAPTSATGASWCPVETSSDMFGHPAILLTLAALLA